MRGTGRRLLRLLCALLAALAGLVALAAPALAHPLGNFTVNSFAALAVEPSAVRVDVVVDRAEIPTARDFPTLDERTGELPDGDARARALCGDQADGARLTAGGQALRLTVSAAQVDFPEGAAGLRTARLTCALRTAELDDELVGRRVEFALADVGGIGWRETTAVGDGVELAGSTVPQDSVSDALRAYPDDLLSSPLDERTAAFDVRSGSGLATGVGALLDRGPVSALPRGADRFTSAFTDLVARDELTVPFVAAALGIALLLGGLHAFAPGHGKTVMAAVLVGRRGAWREAALLGGAVTVTHTAGVVLLGVLLTGVGLASPEVVYPYLGLLSGLLLVGVGVVLLRSARARRREARTTAHVVAPALVPAGGHEHHHHGDHPHEHDHEHHHHAGPRRPPARRAAQPRRPHAHARPARARQRRPRPARRRLRRRPGAQPVGARRPARRHRARPDLVRPAAGPGVRRRHGARALHARPAARARPQPAGGAGAQARGRARRRVAARAAHGDGRPRHRRRGRAVGAGCRRALTGHPADCAG